MGRRSSRPLKLTAKDVRHGLRLAGRGTAGTKTSAYPTYALNLHRSGVACFVLAGHVTPAAVALTEQIHAELPTGAIVGSSGFCSRAWTDPARHGVVRCGGPLPLLHVAAAAGDASTRERGRSSPISGSCTTATPEPYALIGYRAAEMVIDGINNLGNGRDNRSGGAARADRRRPHPRPWSGSTGSTRTAT